MHRIKRSILPILVIASAILTGWAIVAHASPSGDEKSYAEHLAKRQYERSTNCHPGKYGCVIRLREPTTCRRGTCRVHLEGNSEEAWGDYKVRGGHVIFESLFQEVFVDCKGRG